MQDDSLDPVESTGRSLEQRLFSAIPISQAMQVRVLSCGTNGVELSAPLAPNINHEGTAFGGSLHALALFSCWSVATLLVDPFEVDYVVVQDSQMDYLNPVRGDFRARCVGEPERSQRFLATLQRRRLARLALEADIVCGDQVCAKLRSNFVARLEK